MTLTSSQELALQNGRISCYQIPMDHYPPPFTLQLSKMLTMRTLDPVNKSRVVNVSDHIAKYALANGNKASTSTLT